jgi:hypothetical protein
MSDESWLTDHVLDEDDGRQRAEAEDRLAGDPTLRHRSEQLHDVIQRLEALPPSAWDGLESLPVSHADTLDGSSAADPQPGRRYSAQRRRRLAVAALAMVAIFFAGVGVGAVNWSAHGTRATSIRQTIALRPLSARSQARGIARVTESGQLKLALSDLPRTPTGRFYEAWLMTSPARLVPIASFRVGQDGRATMKVLLPASPSRYRFIDISLQRTSAGPAHSHDSVLRGPTGT